jgi:hypothetical protein
MAKVLDMLLLVVSAAGFAALSLYKLILLFRYRNDPVKREALISSGQVYPKRLAKWIFGEVADTRAGKASLSNLGRK